jgi:putative membrane protein insertion efficiency factor
VSTGGRVVTAPIIGAIVLYQRFVSPMRPPTCRYYPSCSAYAVTALRRFGPVKGTWLALKRLGRCHPWTPGGVDHVPELSPELSPEHTAEPTDGVTMRQDPAPPAPAAHQR